MTENFGGGRPLRKTYFQDGSYQFNLPTDPISSLPLGEPHIQFEFNLGQRTYPDQVEIAAQQRYLASQHHQHSQLKSAAVKSSWERKALIGVGTLTAIASVIFLSRWSMPLTTGKMQAMNMLGSVTAATSKHNCNSKRLLIERDACNEGYVSIEYVDAQPQNTKPVTLPLVPQVRAYADGDRLFVVR